jgi:hypothetical protein
VSERLIAELAEVERALLRLSGSWAGVSAAYLTTAAGAAWLQEMSAAADVLRSRLGPGPLPAMRASAPPEASGLRERIQTPEFRAAVDRKREILDATDAAFERGRKAGIEEAARHLRERDSAWCPNTSMRITKGDCGCCEDPDAPASPQATTPAPAEPTCHAPGDYWRCDKCPAPSAAPARETPLTDAEALTPLDDAETEQAMLRAEIERLTKALADARAETGGKGRRRTRSDYEALAAAPPSSAGTETGGGR